MKPASKRRTGRSGVVSVALAALLGACASGPPPPDWHANAKVALDRSVAAYLGGDSRVATLEFERARGEISRTGRVELLARAELMRCAAQVASLEFEPCTGFERLRSDAAAPERAYADHLGGGTLAREAIERLPPAQQVVARSLAGSGGAGAGMQGIEDPLSRLIAVALLFKAGQASPELIALAADTASAQGWRRPLLAWLEVQALRAERAGAVDEGQRLRRRILLVTQAPSHAQ